MPPAGAKNTFLSPAATDLGLGDSLSQQLQDEEDERKRKQAQLGMFGSSASVQSLFGGLGNMTGVSARGYGA
jgi:hypothetical protein